MTGLTSTRATDARIMADDEIRRAKARAKQQRYVAKLRARSPEVASVPSQKRCPGCDKVKPAEAFNRSTVQKSGLEVRCKDCLSRTRYEKQNKAGRSRRVAAHVALRLGLPSTPPVEETSAGPIMRVPLSSGAAAIIDAADWPLVRAYSWHLSTSGYAATTFGKAGEQQRIYMHVLIFGDPSAPEVDHKNRVRLDNRRSNLRAATISQNRANRAKRADSASHFKGVRPTLDGTWNARITHLGQERSLGFFATEQEAARAYDKAALEAFGEFALLNFAT